MFHPRQRPPPLEYVMHGGHHAEVHVARPAKGVLQPVCSATSNGATCRLCTGYATKACAEHLETIKCEM